MEISNITQKRINTLKENFIIPDYCIGRNFLNEDVQEICSLLYEIFPEAEVFCGASKLAIVFNDQEPVIKLPFNGTWLSEDQALSSGYTIEDLYRNDRNFFMIPFYCVPSKKTEWNYCEHELETYQSYAKMGFQDFFASIEYCGTTKNGTPIYVQEKVSNVYQMEQADAVPFSSFKSMRLASKNHLGRTNPRANDPDQRTSWQNWVAVAIDCYGAEEVMCFLEEIKHKDFMEDMHRKNYGFRFDGTPCLLDYSGYYEDF